MKRRFLIPAMMMASMTWGAVVGQDSPTEQKPPVEKIETVIVQHDESLTQDLRKKIEEALEKAGVADEAKEKVLKELERARESTVRQVEKLRERTEKYRENAERMRENSAKLRENAEKLREQLKNQGKSFSFSFDEDALGGNGGMNARVLRMFGDQKYRIGVQTSITVSEDGEDKEEEGLSIDAVFPNSPADKAGIEEGDLLVKADGEVLKSVEQLTKAIQVAGKESKEISIELKRDDKTIELKVKPSEIKDIDSVVENLQLNMPPAGFVVGGDNETSVVSIPGAVSSQMIEELKKEISEMREDIRQIKEMLKDMKK